jgi:hypothetical protein
MEVLLIIKSEFGDFTIICAEDCGNSPKKELIKEFVIALAKNDLDFILANITGDILWNRVGDNLIQGKDDFAENFKQLKDNKAIEIHINTIITHGNTGAANGTLKFEKKCFAFCDVYIFSSAKNAKIKEITSYVIELS